HRRAYECNRTGIRECGGSPLNRGDSSSLAQGQILPSLAVLYRLLPAVDRSAASDRVTSRGPCTCGDHGSPPLVCGALPWISGPWPLVGIESLGEDPIAGTTGGGGSKAWPLVTGPWPSTGIVTFVPGNAGNPPSMRMVCSCSVDPALYCLMASSSRAYWLSIQF